MKKKIYSFGITFFLIALTTAISRFVYIYFDYKKKIAEGVFDRMGFVPSLYPNLSEILIVLAIVIIIGLVGALLGYLSSTVERKGLKWTMLTTGILTIALYLLYNFIISLFVPSRLQHVWIGPLSSILSISAILFMYLSFFYLVFNSLSVYSRGGRLWIFEIISAIALMILVNLLVVDFMGYFIILFWPLNIALSIISFFVLSIKAKRSEAKPIFYFSIAAIVLFIVLAILFSFFLATADFSM